MARGRLAGAARAIVLAFLDFGDRDLYLPGRIAAVGIELLRALAETGARSYSFTSSFGATTLGLEHRFLHAEERSQIGGQRCTTSMLGQLTAQRRVIICVRWRT